MITIRNTLAIAALTSIALASSAFAQQDGQQIATDTAIPSLMFFTLGAALIVAVGGFLYFLRKRSNQEATARGLGMNDE